MPSRCLYLDKTTSQKGLFRTQPAHLLDKRLDEIDSEVAHVDYLLRVGVEQLAQQVHFDAIAGEFEVKHDLRAERE
jgi:hypothetical protein